MTVTEKPGPGRYLDPEKPYYEWCRGESGRLVIMSECCADTFSEAEEIVLRDYLNATHPVEKPAS
jgi:hypothetical protein